MGNRPVNELFQTSAAGLKVLERRRLPFLMATEAAGVRVFRERFRTSSVLNVFGVSG